MRRVLLETHAPEYRGVESFAKLMWGGLIEVSKKSVARAKAASASKTTLQTAMEKFKSKDFESAFLMLEAHLQTSPDDEEAQTLYRLVREAYLAALKQACPDDGIPTLNIDISQLSEKIFSSKEGFIASRVNGQWDVKSLIMVSPLGELESLKIMKKLADEGVLKMTKGKSR